MRTAVHAPARLAGVARATPPIAGIAPVAIGFTETAVRMICVVLLMFG